MQSGLPLDKEYRRFKLSAQITAKLKAHAEARGLGRDDLLFQAPAEEAPRERVPRLSADPDAPLGRTKPNAAGHRYRHGTLTGYSLGRCRCDYCRDAYCRYRAARRADGKDDPRGVRARDTDGHIPSNWFRQHDLVPGREVGGLGGSGADPRPAPRARLLAPRRRRRPPGRQAASRPRQPLAPPRSTSTPSPTPTKPPSTPSPRCATEHQSCYEMEGVAGFGRIRDQGGAATRRRWRGVSAPGSALGGPPGAHAGLPTKGTLIKKVASIGRGHPGPTRTFTCVTWLRTLVMSRPSVPVWRCRV